MEWYNFGDKAMDKKGKSEVSLASQQTQAQDTAQKLHTIIPEPFREQDAGKSEWAKFFAGFKYAFRGLWYALQTQRNMRVHVATAILVIGAGTFFHISAVEFAMLFVAITSVFIAEMFNTVIELCVDLASPTYHPLAKTAKDVAAGAVLLSAILSVIIGLFVLGPHLWTLLTHYF